MRDRRVDKPVRGHRFGEIDVGVSEMIAYPAECVQDALDPTWIATPRLGGVIRRTTPTSGESIR